VHWRAAVIERIGAGDYRRRRWKNGGGWTTDLAVDPPGAGEDFRWRVSIAGIARDGPFSAFPGIDRTLLLLGGDGIELRMAGHDEPLRLQHRFASACFAGETAVECRLVGGPTRDFNVMTRRASVRAHVAAHTLAQALRLDAGTEALVHVIEGILTVNSGAGIVQAGANDSVRIAGAPTLNLEGQATLLLVNFRDPA
jgi:environmental stress-induced protein Ves